MTNKEELIEGLFSAIDSKDTDKFVSYLTDDAEFIMGDAEPIAGKENIRAGVDGFFKSIEGLTHTVDHIIGDENVFATPGTVTYTRLDGSKLKVNYCNVYEFSGEKIRKYNIYINLSELYK